jgi:predicted nucleic acid-binding protein
MIVVSNTSPLTNLAAIGQFELLHCLYTSVHIANAVRDELNAMGKCWPGSKETQSADWIQIHCIHNQLLSNALQRDLDLGESESIVLALELGADLVLLDEKDGRHTAQRFGLKKIGVIGILLEAKKHGLIQAIRPHLDSLRDIAGFYMKDSLYQYALQLANEPNRNP